MKYRSLTDKQSKESPLNSVFSHRNENVFSHDPNATVNRLKEFTHTYTEYSDSSRGKRELECLRVQYPLYFCDIEENDLFAGRDKYPAIGFGAQAHDFFGYYLKEEELDRIMQHKDLEPAYRDIIDELRSFWREHNDKARTKASYPAKMKEVLSSDNWHSEPVIGAPLYRMSGTQCDFDKLVRLGIPGLREEIAGYSERVNADSEAASLYENMESALSLLSEIALYYADMAKLQASKASPGRSRELKKMESVLRAIAVNKPAGFREAIQLVFLHAGISGTFNYGRMDEYLGDLYYRDLKAGILDEEEAIRLLSNLWYLMDAKGHIWDCRVIIGGKGRRNTIQADQLALIIMEATRRVKGVVPQLSLRIYAEQDQRLYRKALDMISSGNPYPMLYNDEAIIPSVAAAFRLPLEEAENYVPFGCGEYVIYHKSVGTPSGVINLLQALSVTLNRGINPVSLEPMGLKPEDFGMQDNFDALFSDYKRLVEYYVEQLAFQEKLEYEMAARSANYLYLSMLFDDCLASGKAIFEGGVRYLGGTLESYGNTNTADALTAIKKIVFDEKKLSLEQLNRILNANYEGFEQERMLLLRAPKFGNDNDEADAMKVEVDRHISKVTRYMAENVGLHSYLVVLINNSANVTMGLQTAASADGRRAFTYMANGNASSSGMDENGLTAYLNSLLKTGKYHHAGTVQNLKFSKDLLLRYRTKTESLLGAYFSGGGAQCMINCLDRDELENAMKEPDKYTNLIVRVGGFSARFVELPHEVQLEILNRTLY
jgi:pyruvate-formate lyase